MNHHTSSTPARRQLRVGILTLPLHTNYGGILQAYALQTVLERMGHEARVLQRDDYRLRLPLWKWPLAMAKRLVWNYVFRRPNDLFWERNYNRAYLIVAQHTGAFVARYVKGRKLKRPADVRPGEFDALVVGSDQVWRPMYYDRPIESAFLDFTEGWQVRRLSYAASFGTDRWEYTRGQTRRCGQLLSRFDAVSVRESSAVGMCREHFGVEATHVLDPTMLLAAVDYERLVTAAAVSPSGGDLLCYVLDETDEKQRVIACLAADGGLTPFRANVVEGDWWTEPERHVQPAVEQWLRGFMDARLVVTDSFHACVFSILFRKPFVVIGNAERGLARIHSLLAMFGLEHCLYGGGQPAVPAIDWTVVSARLDEWRKRSTELLRQGVEGG